MDCSGYLLGAAIGVGLVLALDLALSWLRWRKDDADAEQFLEQDAEQPQAEALEGYLISQSAETPVPPPPIGKSY